VVVFQFPILIPAAWLKYSLNFWICPRRDRSFPLRCRGIDTRANRRLSGYDPLVRSQSPPPIGVAI
jgi:hypothetical protein